MKSPDGPSSSCDGGEREFHPNDVPEQDVSMSENVKNSSASGWSLAAAAYIFTTVMIGTTMPTPLYPQYQEVFGFGGMITTELFAIYAAGVILGLILFGRLSEATGRRPVLMAGLVLSVISAVLFWTGIAEWMLFTGRVFSGFAAGLLTSTGTVSVMENAPKGRARLGGAVATAANMGGLGLGVLMAGVVSQVALAILPEGWSLRSPYMVHAIMLVIAGLALVKVRDPVDRSHKGFRLQTPGIPSEARRQFGAASVAAVVGFATMGIYSSVVPNVLTGVLHVKAPAAVGIIIGLVFLTSAVAQICLKGLEDRSLILVGSLFLAVGMAFSILALWLGSLFLLVIAALLSGSGQGLLFMTGMRAVTKATRAERRTEVTTSYFVVAYLSISVPSVAAGLLIPGFGLAPTGFLFFAVIGAVTLLGLLNLPKFQGK
ncbi:MFS transporter [Kocuria sp. TGY1127_2]|nr:MFS transporter [Kocuria sp. TGY1127_2]